MRICTQLDRALPGGNLTDGSFLEGIVKQAL